MFSVIKAFLIKDNHYLNFAAIGIIFLVAFLFSVNKKKINVREIFTALLMQILLALFVLKTSIGHKIFKVLSAGFVKLYSFAGSGIEFVFGGLSDASGPWGYIFAVKVLTAFIFFGALMSLLSYLGVIKFTVKIISFVMRPLLGTSGAETLCAASSCVLGPTESPLLIKKYLKGMTESEIFVLMVSGMSTLSASVLAIYGSMGIPMIHLLVASVMAVPGSILMSKILIPETGVPETLSSKLADDKNSSGNVLDAIASGTSDGLYLALHVGAMLIAFISLIAFSDYILVKFSSSFLSEVYTLDKVFAKLFAVVATFIGVTSEDAGVAGTLLGQKLVLNEFIAYANMIKSTLSERSTIILTYAICGFANISVIGILIGGVGVLCPEQRSTLAKLGWKALLGGTLVNLLNASIAALLI